MIQTDAGKEENACRKCRQAFPDGSYDDVFVPGYMKLTKRDGAWTEERKVLFPGYFFADAKEPDVIEDILRNYLSRIAKPEAVILITNRKHGYIPPVSGMPILIMKYINHLLRMDL